MLSLQEQHELFDHMRDGIDRELRNTGLEDFLSAHEVDVSDGRLVVARFSIYLSDLATHDIARDPMSRRLATQYEVGVMTESPQGRHYKGIPVSEAMDGQPHAPFGVGEELDYIQHISILSSVRKLRDARRRGALTFLVKSLKKIDPCGD